MAKKTSIRSSKDTEASATHISGREAAAMLDVKPQTLYAYVSRGLIRSVAVTGSARRLYSRADVEKLRARAQARSGHGPVAAAAMHYGEPIIQTAITEITPEGPRYRDRSAIELARANRPFENVAELLWTGRDFQEPIIWELEASPPDVSCFTNCLGRLWTEKPLSQVMSYLTLSINMMLGRAAQRNRYRTGIIAARQLIMSLTGCFGYLRARPAYVRPKNGLSVVHAVLRACDLPDTTENVRAVNTMMVLLADHELSPATFAARITASVGADLYTCLVCALESGSGAKVADVYEQLDAYLDPAPGRAALMRKASALLEAGHVPPGFNHPAYPEGDARTHMVLELALQVKRPAAPVKGICAFIAEAEQSLGLKPRFELGITVLARAIGLPRGALVGIYSLARIAGWTAHVQEQRLSNAMLRPRARYIGNATMPPADPAGVL